MPLVNALAAGARITIRHPIPFPSPSNPEMSEGFTRRDRIRTPGPQPPPPKLSTFDAVDAEFRAYQSHAF